MKKFFIGIFAIFAFLLSTQNAVAYTVTWDNYFGNYYDNYYYDNYGYEPYCPYMSYYDEWTQVCECYGGYVWYDYQCVSQHQYCQNVMGANARYDAASNSCVDRNINQYRAPEPQREPQRNVQQQQNTGGNPYINNQNTTQTDNRPRPTEIPPLARNTPIPPDPTNGPRAAWPTLMPSMTPHPIPEWLKERLPTAEPTPVRNNGKDILLYQRIENIVTPTLIPARRPSGAVVIKQADAKTASSSGFFDWLGGLFKSK